MQWCAWSGVRCEERHTFAKENGEDDHAKMIDRAKLEKGLDESRASKQLHVAVQSSRLELRKEVSRSTSRCDNICVRVRGERAGGENIDSPAFPRPDTVLSPDHVPKVEGIAADDDRINLFEKLGVPVRLGRYERGDTVPDGETIRCRDEPVEADTNV